jgi:hypothetical protein
MADIQTTTTNGESSHDDPVKVKVLVLARSPALTDLYESTEIGVTVFLKEVFGPTVTIEFVRLVLPSLDEDENETLTTLMEADDAIDDLCYRLDLLTPTDAIGDAHLNIAVQAASHGQFAILFRRSINPECPYAFVASGGGVDSLRHGINSLSPANGHSTEQAQPSEQMREVMTNMEKRALSRRVGGVLLHWQTRMKPPFFWTEGKSKSSHQLRALVIATTPDELDGAEAALRQCVEQREPGFRHWTGVQIVSRLVPSFLPLPSEEEVCVKEADATFESVIRNDYDHPIDDGLVLEWHMELVLRRMDGGDCMILVNHCAVQMTAYCKFSRCDNDCEYHCNDGTDRSSKSYFTSIFKRSLLAWHSVNEDARRAAAEAVGPAQPPRHAEPRRRPALWRRRT